MVEIGIGISLICFSVSSAIKQNIAVQLAALEVQSRFMRNSTDTARFIDTPKSTVQGFVVDLSCASLGNITDEVISFFNRILHIEY